MIQLKISYFDTMLNYRFSQKLKRKKEKKKEKQNVFTIHL